MDLRGCGDSDAPSQLEDYSLEKLCHDIRDAIDELGTLHVLARMVYRGYLTAGPRGLKFCWSILLIRELGQGHQMCVVSPHKE